MKFEVRPHQVTAVQNPTDEPATHSVDLNHDGKTDVEITIPARGWLVTDANGVSFALADDEFRRRFRPVVADVPVTEQQPSAD